MSVDLPDPDTPVMRMSLPNGNSTVIFLRLLPVQPRKRSEAPSNLPRLGEASESAIASPSRGRLEGAKYFAVSVSAFSNSSGVPWNTTSPPLRPARGPMSTIQSAASIMSRSCSTTMTVLPKSRSSFNERMSRSLSRWCNPIEGSSRM